MGCSQSTAVEPQKGSLTQRLADRVSNKSIKQRLAASQQASEQAKLEKPKPQVFAIMRNGHEVIRGAQLDLKELIEAGDLDGAHVLWEKHSKWMHLHMTMEEGNGSDGSPKGMFKVLNEKFDGIVEKASLSDMHDDLHAKEKAISEAFAAKNIRKVQSEFAAYDSINLSHLNKEEGIMMPKVQEMKKMGVPMKKLMIQELLALVVDSPDFEFFVKFANEILEKHTGGMPRARVWDHALWAVATPDQWTVWDAWIKETLKPETYQELQDAIAG
eukprot:CAMPEP_0168770362 /NCGR_PEP_ID=MMETSP0725-20121227/2879_1 /TAXON_ID=265536 /ORGANISM="Amphiprora sp., Strain CCMP467" /LENGTH=271 /DNA_ID=CAMNT_0008819801 /DNA_START=24 /DNA_END=839 /DNA_ORIENTATION=-